MILFHVNEPKTFSIYQDRRQGHHVNASFKQESCFFQELRQEITIVRLGKGGGADRGQLTSEGSKHLRNCQSFQIYNLIGLSAVFVGGEKPTALSAYFLSDTSYQRILRKLKYRAPTQNA